MVILAHILLQAVDLYLREAYPKGAPADVELRIAPIRKLGPDEPVPLAFLQRDEANSIQNYVLRLGQPNYPFMKLALDPVPERHEAATGSAARRSEDYLLRVDTHDRHLHAAPGSPDEAWLAGVRASNKELGDRIEAAWAAAGLPTFKEYLRRQLEERKRAAAKQS